MQSLFTSNEVAELTGATLRQIQWWAERKVFVPELGRPAGRLSWVGRGDCRLYSVKQVQEIRTIVMLREKGLSMQNARSVLPDLRKQMAMIESGHLYLAVFRERSWKIVSSRTPEDVLKAMVKHSGPAYFGEISLAIELRAKQAMSKEEVERIFRRMVKKGAKIDEIAKACRTILWVFEHLSALVASSACLALRT